MKFTPKEANLRETNSSLAGMAGPGLSRCRNPIDMIFQPAMLVSQKSTQSNGGLVWNFLLKVVRELQVIWPFKQDPSWKSKGPISPNAAQSGPYIFAGHFTVKHWNFHASKHQRRT